MGTVSGRFAVAGALGGVFVSVQKAITHEAQRVFKIVLAGDAAVGKSSFILRLCKNKFIPNLSSTLGSSNSFKLLSHDSIINAGVTRKRGQSYRHADPRRH